MSETILIGHWDEVNEVDVVDDDITDICQEVQYTRAQPGGPASFSCNVATAHPDLPVSNYLKDGARIWVWDGSICTWDGFVLPLKYDIQNHVIGIEASGMLDRAKQNTNFQKLFITASYDDWQKLRNSDRGIQIDLQGHINITALANKTFVAQDFGGAWFAICDGLDYTDSIHKVTFNAQWHLITSGGIWHARILACADYQDNPADGGTLVFDYWNSDQTDPFGVVLATQAIGGYSTDSNRPNYLPTGTKVLYVYIYVSAASTPPSNRSFSISTLRVMTSATAPTISGAMSTIAQLPGLATSTDIPATVGNALSECYFRPGDVSNVAEALDNLGGKWDSIIEWGFENRVFYEQLRPAWTAIPRNHVFVITDEECVWDVYDDDEEEADVVRVLYECISDGLWPDGAIRAVYWPHGTNGNDPPSWMDYSTRVATEDWRTMKMTANEATLVAHNIYRRMAISDPLGTVSGLTSTVTTIDGAEVPVGWIKQGDWIMNTSRVNSAPVYISGTTCNLGAPNTCDLDIGLKIPTLQPHFGKRRSHWKYQGDWRTWKWAYKWNKKHTKKLKYKLWTSHEGEGWYWQK